MEAHELRREIMGLLGPKLRRAGLEPADLRDEWNLVGEGLMDSFAFVEFLEALQARCGIRIQLGRADPAEMTTIGGLTRHLIGV